METDTLSSWTEQDWRSSGALFSTGAVSAVCYLQFLVLIGLERLGLYTLALTSQCAIHFFGLFMIIDIDVAFRNFAHCANSITVSI